MYRGRQRSTARVGHGGRLCPKMARSEMHLHSRLREHAESPIEGAAEQKGKEAVSESYFWVNNHVRSGLTRAQGTFVDPLTPTSKANLNARLLLQRGECCADGLEWQHRMVKCCLALASSLCPNSLFKYLCKYFLI